MKFPLEYPLFRFLYWLVNTGGIGSIMVMLVGSVSLTIYYFTGRWIVKGGENDEKEEYTFPTPALFDHD